MKNVTVIIPSYRSDPYVLDLYNNLIDQGFDRKNIKIIDNNDHFAQKCNTGAMNCDTEYVLFLNNDTQPEKGFAEKLMNTLQKEDEWIATPMIIFHKTVVRHVIWDDQVQHVFGVKGKVQCAGVDFNIQALPYEYGRLAEQSNIKVKFRRRCLGASGCCFLMKRDKFIELGGFDESFINGWEDNDFMLRVLQAGGMCVYEPEAKITHHFAGSEGRFDHEQENYAHFIQKWEGKNIQVIMNARKRI